MDFSSWLYFTLTLTGKANFPLNFAALDKKKKKDVFKSDKILGLDLGAALKKIDFRRIPAPGDDWFEFARQFADRNKLSPGHRAVEPYLTKGEWILITEVPIRYRNEAAKGYFTFPESFLGFF